VKLLQRSCSVAAGLPSSEEMALLVWERAQRLLHHSPHSNMTTIPFDVGTGGMTSTTCPQSLAIYTSFINASE